MALVSSNQRRYGSCDAWTHICSEAEFSEIERTTRWVFYRQEQALVFVDVQRDQQWRSGSRSEIEDVTDSLVNGHPGCLDIPQNWEFAESDVPLNWVLFYRMSPLGTITPKSHHYNC